MKEPVNPSFAYVTAVWGGDRYYPGALVLAGSLRRVGARHDLVCMVTSDVSEPAVAGLSKVFDHVVRVDTITHASRRFTAERQSSLYNHWIDTSFTKWNALRLVSYARVLYVDADVLFLSNCDELFDLQAPAACFSMPWSGGIADAYAPKGRPLPHGAAIDPRRVLAALGRPADGPGRGPQPSFVGCTWLALLSPSTDRLGDILDILDQQEVYADGYTCTNGPDEMVLAEMFASRGEWFRHIHPKFAAIPWHSGWVGADCRALHYHGETKPWESSRDSWSDLAAWWDVADTLAGKHPGLFSLPDNDLSPEVSRVRVSTRLLQFILDAVTRLSPRLARSGELARREVNNVAERWFLALANANPGRPFHGTILRPDGDSANTKMVGELVDLVRGKDRSVEDSGLASAAADVLLGAKEIVSAAADIRVAPSPAVRLANGRLSCGGIDLASGVSAKRLSLLVEMGGLPAVGLMALRYESLAPGGCQWRLPREHVANLYKTHGVRNEGFASPLNSNLLGLEGGSYCSLFPDADLPFGSLGSFFDADLLRGGAWVVNPPFIENVLALATKKVLTELSRVGPRNPPLVIFFVAPSWDDSAALNALTSSSFLVAYRRLPKNTYFYEDLAGTPITARFDSSYFALSSDPQGVTREQLSPALDYALLAPTVEPRATSDRWPKLVPSKPSQRDGRPNRDRSLWTNRDADLM